MMVGIPSSMTTGRPKRAFSFLCPPSEAPPAPFVFGMGLVAGAIGGCEARTQEELVSKRYGRDRGHSLAPASVISAAQLSFWNELF
jgi:hypothetical protein